jgi:hypothetical protein
VTSRTTGPGGGTSTDAGGVTSRAARTGPAGTSPATVIGTCCPSPVAARPRAGRLTAGAATSTTGRPATTPGTCGAASAPSSCGPGTSSGTRGGTATRRTRGGTATRATPALTTTRRIRGSGAASGACGPGAGAFRTSARRTAAWRTRGPGTTASGI